MAKTFGKDWNSELCKDMREFSLLETHRRALALEGFLEKCGDQPLIAMAVHSKLASRALAFSPHKYVVVDPFTMCLPFLLHHSLETGVEEHDTGCFRLHALAVSLQPLLAYGQELTAIAKQLPPERLSGATAWLFEPPYAFLPEPMRMTIAPDSMDRITGRRRDKEQASGFSVC